jgi:hypothetical protein
MAVSPSQKYAMVPVDPAAKEFRDFIAANAAQVKAVLGLLLFVVVGLFSLSVSAAPIPGFRPGLNLTGFDTGGTVYVPIQSTGTNGHLKQEYLDLLATVYPKGGRDMDYLQDVTNDTTTWATRSANDFSSKGITYETDVNIANQLRDKVGGYTPWINSPLMADAAHDRMLGQLWGQSFRGQTIRFGKGNEVWNVFGQNLGAWNLNQAKAEGYSGSSDFEKLSRRQGDRLATATEAFKQGLADVGWNGQVIMEVEGFAPVTSYADYQLDEMKKRGHNPVALNARVAIAQYAAGSESDLAFANLTPSSTFAQMAAAVKTFINGSLVPWTNNHKSLAVAYGLTPVVDAYEFRLGQSPASTQAMTDRWVAFQNSNEEQALQDYGWRTLVDASGGVDAMLNAEGVYGFPWFNIGQFPLLDLNQMNDPTASGAYRGTLGVVDETPVPEPKTLILAGFLGCVMSLLRR